MCMRCLVLENKCFYLFGAVSVCACVLILCPFRRPSQQTWNRKTKLNFIIIIVYKWISYFKREFVRREFMQITMSNGTTGNNKMYAVNAKATARKLVSTSNCVLLLGWCGACLLAYFCLSLPVCICACERVCERVWVSGIQVNEVRMAQKPYRILSYLVIVIVTPLPSLPLSSSSSSSAIVVVVAQTTRAPNMNK